MFDEQIALNKKLNSSSNFLHEEGSLKENSDIIAKRLKMLHKKQEELTKEIRGLRAANQDLETEMLRVKGEAIAQPGGALAEPEHQVNPSCGRTSLLT